MTHIIALSMEQFPQQKVYLVVDLPSRPESFKVYCNDEYETPVEGMPKEMPRSATYVGTAEWAWTPMNSRLDAYFISTNRQRSHWILWKVWIDDDDLIPKWKGHILTYGPRKGIKKKDAAIYLIMDMLTNDKSEYELDHFHFLDNVGLLSVAEFMAIGRVVWPEANRI